MKCHLSKEQGDYFDQIERVTLSICNGYRNIYTAKIESEQEQHLSALKSCISFEQELYETIPSEFINDMLNYFNEVYSIWSFSKNNDNNFITDILNQDYQTYFTLFHLGKSDFWFCSMQRALIHRVLKKLIECKAKGQKLEIVTNMVEQLVYCNLFKLLNGVVKDTHQRRMYYEFVKYDWAIRNPIMESCLLGKNLNDEFKNLKEEYLAMLQTDMKEGLYSFIFNCIKQVLIHLTSLSDEKLESISDHIVYVAELDLMILRGYNMLLDEQYLKNVMAYRDNMFNYDANLSNCVRSKKMIKKAFDCYAMDRQNYLDS